MRKVIILCVVISIFFTPTSLKAQQLEEEPAEVVADPVPAGPNAKPPGSANMRYFIEEQEKAGMTGMGAEREPPDWALPYLRGEVEKPSAPEPLPLAQ